MTDGTGVGFVDQGGGWVRQGGKTGGNSPSPCQEIVWFVLEQLQHFLLVTAFLSCNVPWGRFLSSCSELQLFTTQSMRGVGVGGLFVESLKCGLSASCACLELAQHCGLHSFYRLWLLGLLLSPMFFPSLKLVLQAVHYGSVQSVWCVGKNPGAVYGNLSALVVVCAVSEWGEVWSYVWYSSAEYVNLRRMYGGLYGPYIEWGESWSFI